VATSGRRLICNPQDLTRLSTVPVRSVRAMLQSPSATPDSPDRQSPNSHSPGLSPSRPAGGPIKRRLRAATIVSVLGGMGLLLAACSSGSANAASSKSTSTTTKGAASFTAYENCLKSHGVNFTGGFGGFGGGGGTGGPPPSGSTRPTIPASERAAFTKAESACASLRPKFNGGGGGAGSTEFAAYRNCLKLHGVTLPTGRGAGGFPGSGTSTPTTTTSKEKAAEAACASLRPKGGFGGRTTTTTS
jgi:hypothetical protein